MATKQWQTPELVVLTRGVPDECYQLAACKYSQINGPQAGQPVNRDCRNVGPGTGWQWRQCSELTSS